MITNRIKRGANASLPNGAAGEPLFTTDTYDLYIGKGDGTNQRYQKYMADAINGTGVANQLAYFSGANTIAGSTFLTLNLTADNGYLILTGGATYKNADIWLNRYSNAWENAIRFQTNGTTDWYVGSSATGSNSDFEIYNYGTSANGIKIAKATNNVTIGGTLTATIGALATAATNFVTSDSGTLKSRTASEVLSDIGAQATSEKGQNNGYASLDSGGKVPVAQLPNSIMEYKGNWNASTNTPTLADGTGNAGDVYLCNVAGTVNLGSGNITFAVGDWCVYNGTIWQKSINSNAVVSVNGQTGVVVITLDSISPMTTLGDIIYGGASGTATRLAGNTTTTRRFLRQTGTGSVSAAPAWDTVTKTDVGLSNVENTALSTWAGSTNITTLGTITSGTWNGSTIAIANGGTGATTKAAAFDALSPMTTLGDVIYGGATGTGTRLAGNITTTKQYLSQTGNGTASAAPTWATIAGSDITGAALTKTDDTNVTLTLGGTPATALLRAASLTLGWTGQLSVARGGTGASTAVAAFDNLSPLTTLGDTLYHNGTDNVRLAGNTTTTKQYLSQTGTGTVSAAPSWSTIAGSDITGAALTKTDDTNVTLTLGGTPATALLRAASITAGWTGQLSVARGGTGAASFTAGQILYGNGTSAIASSATFTYTPTSALLVNNSVTAASAIARGVNVTSTLVAAANGDALVGVRIAPTFTNGAFTGVTNTALSVVGNSNFKDNISLEDSGSTNKWLLYHYTDNTLRFNYNGAGNDEFILDTSGGLRMIGFAVNQNPTSTLTSQTFTRYLNTGGDTYIGLESSVAGGFFGGSQAYDSVYWSSTAANFIIGGISRLRITTSGFLGINQSTPNNFIHITGNSGTVGATQITLEDNANGYGAGFNAASRTSVGGTLVQMGKVVFDGEGLWNTTASTQDAYYSVWVAENGSLIQRQVIRSDGNVYFGNGITSATPLIATLRATNGTGTNIAGAEFRIVGGVGTGTGAGGSITFYTAAAGTSGATLNTATEKMSISATGVVRLNTYTTNGLVYTQNGDGSLNSAARTINGTTFNGSANITTANWGTARTITIGLTGKSVNGSANVSWTIAEIGALALTGGTLTGALTGTTASFSTSTNATAGISARNTSNGTAAGGQMFVGNDATTNGAGYGLFSSGFTASGQYRTSGAYFYSNQAGGLTIHAEGANSMYFATNGTTALTINSSQAATFTNAVTTGGNINIPNGSYYRANRSTGSATISCLGFASGSDTLSITGGTSGASTSIKFADTGGDIAGFYDGNFGVGTITPSGAKLVVYGSAAAAANVTLLNLANGSDGGIKLNFSNSVAAELASITAGVTGTGAGTDDGTLIFRTATNGVASDRLIIYSTGASTFFGKTNISSNISDYAFTITNTNANSYGMYLQAGGTYNAIDVYNAAGTTQLFSLTGSGAATFSSSVSTTFISVSSSNGQIGGFNSTNANGGYVTWSTSGTTIADLGTSQQIFGTGGNGTFGINARGARNLVFGANNAERMRVVSDGNVLIGETTSSTSRLVVRKDAAGARGGEISIVNYTASTLNSSAALNFGLEASTYDADNGNAQIKAQITNAGNSASDMIFSTWNGSAFGERFRIASAGAATFSSSVTAAGGFFDTSDARVKTIIERNPNINIDVDLVKYTKNGDNIIRYGYIAQEVQNINGDVVSGSDILTLNYQDIHSIKIAALEKEIKELKSKIK